LVGLESAEHATYLIDHAKNLRHSARSYVRDKIYLNPDRTKAEASAAYQLRCQRRSRASGRTDGRPSAHPDGPVRAPHGEQPSGMSRPLGHAASTAAAPSSATSLRSSSETRQTLNPGALPLLLLLFPVSSLSTRLHHLVPALRDGRLRSILQISIVSSLMPVVFAINLLSFTIYFILTHMT
jgi:hypothetical protein